MKVGQVLDAITDAIRLTERLERLQQDVDKLADAFVADSKERDKEVRELDRRVQRIENLIEFTQEGARRRLEKD